MMPANTAAVHKRFRRIVQRARRRLDAQEQATLARVKRLPNPERVNWRQFKETPR